MYPRKQLDISLSDLACAAFYCAVPRSIRAKEAELESMFAPAYPVLSAFTVRTGFDLCLGALAFPAGSEILMTALTIPEMVNIAKHHGLVPIPLDIEGGTMAPEIATIESAITERTRAIVVAHLFGTRVPMGPVIELAKKHRILVIEDCAQAFTGPDYTGHPETDVAMFSFGSIKTMTALGGALLRVKDAELLRKMRVIQRTHPAQTRKQFAGTVLKHVLLRLFTLPLLFGMFYRGCKLFGADFESVIAKVRGLDGEDWLKEIQWQCSYPLLALLAHRLRTFNAERLKQRVSVGAEFAKTLPWKISYPGESAEFHSFWVFPILVEARERFMEELHRRGFDGTAAGSALAVIEPPAGRENQEPEKTREVYRKLLYLPVYAKVPSRERKRLSKEIAQISKDTPHLHVTDARRVYSAVAGTIETPRSAAEILNALHRAKRDGVPVCMMGTGHNLGGHAFVNGATVLDMRQFNRVISLDKDRKRITVESGITWDKIQRAVSPAGLALKAMQSDNIFTVGGSLAANAHGRDTRFPTLAESVLGFRILLADGSVKSVSRDENPDLFRNAIGGYGLFGVMLDVDLELLEDCVYEQSSAVLPLAGLVDYFEKELRANLRTELFLARPSISPECLLEDTIVTLWRRTDRTRKRVFQLDHERHVARDRFLFGLSRRYQWGKVLRWYAEKWVAGGESQTTLVSRNNAMRPPVSSVKMLEHDSTTDADVIQEFFIPIPRFMAFMEAMRRILLEDGTNLLGVTLRYVRANNEAALSYALKEDAFAVILYFNELCSAAGRARGDELIKRLNHLALQCEGTFYLTYVRDLDRETLKQAYPGIDAFFQKKHSVDPENRFTSRFFEMHGRRELAKRAASGS
jgi:FAD/FMN-containing dehydrogenase/dTDP-4-amino-4,6-dideoxygalactose transaminase